MAKKLISLFQASKDKNSPLESKSEEKTPELDDPALVPASAHDVALYAMGYLEKHRENNTKARPFYYAYSDNVTDETRSIGIGAENSMKEQALGLLTNQRTHRYYLARKSCDIPAFCGDQFLHVIVPAELTVKTNDVSFHDFFDHNTYDSFPDIYVDVMVEMVKLGHEGPNRDDFSDCPDIDWLRFKSTFSEQMNITLPITFDDFEELSEQGFKDLIDLFEKDQITTDDVRDIPNAVEVNPETGLLENRRNHYIYYGNSPAWKKFLPTPQSPEYTNARPSSQTIAFGDIATGKASKSKAKLSVVSSNDNGGQPGNKLPSDGGFNND